MLQPTRTKYRKAQKGRMRGRAKGADTVSFGDYGLQALECAWISARQLEAARVAMTRHIKRGGKVYIRIFPDKPITKKPAETRMGKGKAPTRVGWRWSGPDGSCTRLKASTRSWRARPSTWRTTSSPCPPAWWRGSKSDHERR